MPSLATEIVKADIAPVVSEVPLVLQKIAWCESRNKQFNNDGTIHRGAINKKDVGKYQINEYYHLNDSIRLGYDIYSESGNTAYALHLYLSQGTTPWSWSAPCWKNDLTLQQLKQKYK